MIRRIIHIDEEKCNGCGKCVHACHEGAIDLVNGKARLMREHYCDGLGDCLPSCPTGAITFEEREAPAYDEAAVLAAKAKKGEKLSDEEIESKIDAMADDAMKSGNIAVNPRSSRKQDIVELYHKAL